jgi:hypothetical protein
MMQLRRHRRGGQAIEFALLLPVLVLLTGGMIDIAYVLGTRQALVMAVQEGARVGSTYDWREDDETVDATIDVGLLAAQDAWDFGGRPQSVDFTGALVDVGGRQVLRIRGRADVDVFFDFIGMPAQIEFDHHMRVVDQP